jgi:hypothetical protein
VEDVLFSSSSFLSHWGMAFSTCCSSIFQEKVTQEGWDKPKIKPEVRCVGVEYHHLSEASVAANLNMLDISDGNSIPIPRGCNKRE